MQVLSGLFYDRMIIQAIMTAGLHGRNVDKNNNRSYDFVSILAALCLQTREHTSSAYQLNSEDIL